MTDSQSSTDTRFLQRPGGRIAYELTGSGPLVVCVPGMGELRATFRFLAPALAEAGFQVAAMDLRGHGDSDVTFDRYDDVALESDIRALIEELGGPAIVIGNSMGAAAAVLVAVDHPDVMRGLVLTGPFVRDVPQSRLQELMMRAAMAGPWARRVWLSYYPKFYPGQRPADFEEYRARMSKSLRGKDKTRAFSRTTRTSHAQTEAVLDSVRMPTLVVMGSADPDFPDPTAEAHMIARRTEGTAHIVDGAGHYPHAQRPDEVNPAVIEFVRSLPTDA
jgi:pimeloyl-ACP methyl ester carboxylesterase